MNRTSIAPGSVLGVLGGGQLGSMFASAAKGLGFAVAVWDPDPDAPAHRLATYSFPKSFSDAESFNEFAGLVSVVTYEWENVPVELCQRLEQGKPVRPSSGILRIIQNRVVQKKFLSDHGFPVAPFLALTDPQQLPQAIGELGCPALCKTATAGYDGKGQWRIDEPSIVSAAQESLRGSARAGMEWIVESFVPFERELSILIARAIDGQTVAYPVVENEHEEGILRTTVMPADVPASVKDQADEVGRAVVQQMEGIGLFCIELFLLPKGELVINEVAPRPHNSGHYTLDACHPSQFEQQVRAVCGMPLAEIRLFSSAAMVNLIGADAETIKSNTMCRDLLALPGTHLHLYGKRAIRPRRKMGHVTFLAEQRETAYDRAVRFRRCLMERHR